MTEPAATRVAQDARQHPVWLGGLWIGLSGSLLRQATYGASRFGIYAELRNRDMKKHGDRGDKGKSRLKMVQNGAIAGVFAGIVGAPAELIMVRMCSDGLKPATERVNYRNALQGLYRIAIDDGGSRVFRGLGATTVRSVIMNATQLSCYDIFKERLLLTEYFTDSVPLYLLTAALGGTVAVTACAPVDVIKSRIQASTAHGVKTTSIIAKSLRQEGVMVLFRGWLPAWLRMTPTTTLTFMFLEQLKKVF